MRRFSHSAAISPLISSASLIGFTFAGTLVLPFIGILTAKKYLKGADAHESPFPERPKGGAIANKAMENSGGARNEKDIYTRLIK
ncbi:MAG: hypothetical protein HY514_02185 [Candidatus Aenigmarchaeota archaeon]|nr:hypothetical protein [Candidatus Aenigmarchaeota archaeon]